MDPLVELLTTKYGLSPAQARAEAARMTGRGADQSISQSSDSESGLAPSRGPVIVPLDPRGEYARVFGAEAPSSATDMQVQQAVDAEMERRSYRQPDGPPTRPVITEPTPGAISSQRIAYYNQLRDKESAGKKLSDDERAYLVRVQNSSLAGRKERQRAVVQLGGLKGEIMPEKYGYAFDAQMAQRDRARRNLEATGLPPGLYPPAQAQMAGWATRYQYPVMPYGVPMKLEK